MRVSGCSPVVKIVSLFLIGILVLAMFGKLRIPGKARLQAAKCKTCGRYRIGKSGCDCTKKP